MLTALAAGASTVPAQTTLFTSPEAGPDFGQYQRVEDCLAAFNRVRNTVWWGAGRDTLVLDLAGPWPAEAISVVRSCGMRFPLAAAAERELWHQFQLSLAMNDSARAAAIVERWRTAMRAAPPRVWGVTLRQIIETYLRDRPVNLPVVQALLAELEALGPEAGEEQLRVHWDLVRHALSVPDLALEERMAWKALASQKKQWSDSLRKNNPIIQGGILNSARKIMLSALVRGEIDSALALYHTIATTAIPAGPTRDSVMSHDRIGRPAPLLQGDFWFPQEVGAGRVPRLGRVSLLVAVDHRCDRRCIPGFATLRRLKQRFGAAIDVVLIGQSWGYFRLHLPQTPAAEAEFMRTYYLDSLALPAILSVSTTPFTRIPDPDRRVVFGKVPNASHYGGGRYGIGATLVDHRGTVVWGAQLAPNRERILEMVISALVVGTPVRHHDPAARDRASRLDVRACELPTASEPRATGSPSAMNTTSSTCGLRPPLASPETRESHFIG